MYLAVSTSSSASTLSTAVPAVLLIIAAIIIGIVYIIWFVCTLSNIEKSTISLQLQISEIDDRLEKTNELLKKLSDAYCLQNKIIDESELEYFEKSKNNNKII